MLNSAILDQLAVPIVQAPMAGGPSTPALAAAVSRAGGLGFLAAGYRSIEDLASDLGTLRGKTPAPFGVNLFAPPARPAPPPVLAAYGERLAAEAARYGVAIGEPRFDDDSYAAKLELLASEPVAVISFTFGCPPPDVVGRLRASGAEVWVTITAPAEAEAARAAGATALVVQGTEAGGHRAYFVDGPDKQEYGLLSLLRILAAETDLPLVGTGGIMDGAAVAAVLCAGAAAAQLGSALMLTPEAGTSPAHRAALAGASPTRLTRAFSGRQARGIVNRFMDEHDAEAPLAYPEIHHMTSPLRAAARSAGEPDGMNLWAGQAHALARELPAAKLVGVLAAEAAEALRAATGRLTR